ncbi:MAG: low molecular weight protein arginine phosphatase [Anaerolineae bacterium]
MKQNILVVCTGNICRSPMATALLAAQAAKMGDGERLAFSSAGTWAREGDQSSANAQIVMQRRGLSIQGHRARTVTRELIEEADLVLVMTQNQRDSLRAEFSQSRRKIYLLSELIGMQYDISDPYGNALDEYETCASGLDYLIAKGYPRLAELMDQARAAGAKT